MDRAEDAYHNLILELVHAIERNVLREPETLRAFAMTIARRKVIMQIREITQERRTVVDVAETVLSCAASESPEQLVLRSEREEIAKRVLAALPVQQRETLIRFYLDGESPDEIRATMGLSENQFRLIKSRAKLRYAELVQQTMNRVSKRRSADAALRKPARREPTALVQSDLTAREKDLRMDAASMHCDSEICHGLNSTPNHTFEVVFQSSASVETEHSGR
jgi:RNA polymerase sigma factor (sigma-70 family)